MELDENCDGKNSQDSSELKLPKADSDVDHVEDANLYSPNDSEASTMALEPVLEPRAIVEGLNNEDNDADSEVSKAVHLTTKRKNKTLSLIVSNLPKNFNYTQIKNYLEDACGPCDVRILKDKAKCRTAKAVFKSQNQLERAKDVLNSNSIDDLNIVAYESDSDLTQDEGPRAKRKKEVDDSSWGLDMDVWRTDPRGLYGVKPQYLSTLGINDALQNWVLVINFRCGREELKEVMEMAGDVLVCSVMSQKSCPYANVMYRHPLEALQAISMLNGQMFYGKPLTVKLLKQCALALPKGLNNVGPGLAKYGKPLRDVVRHYERFIKGAENNLNCNIFRTPMEQATNDDDAITESDDSKKKAKDAIENLIAEGVEIKDFVFALKAIIEAQKDESLDSLIKELADAADIDSNELDASTSKNDKEVARNLELSKENSKSIQNSKETPKKSQNGSGAAKSAPGSPKSVRKSIEASKDSETVKRIRTKSVSGSRTPLTPSPSMPTIRCKPINQIRPVGPKTNYQSPGPRNTGPSGPVRPMGMRGSMGSNGPRNPGPNSGPLGPMFVPSGMTSGPVRPMGPNSGPQGPMCGPMSGPMSGSSGSVWSMSGPGGPGGPMSGPGGPMSGQNGPMCGPNGQMSGPNGPMSGPGGPMTSQGGPMSFGSNSGSEATLQFSNLPLSTTFALLSDKLSKVGQLQSIQFTLPGCVIVKYGSRAHAERCFQLFNQTRLDGNLVNVSFI